MRPKTLFIALPIVPLLMFIVGCAVSAGEKSASAGEKFCEYKVENLAINKPLCGAKGDAKRGRVLAVKRDKGNCLACHVMPIPEEGFHGNTGPSLEGVASRYTVPQLRLRVADEKLVNPRTLMPSFYANPAQYTRVVKKYRGKTVLTAQEAEDIIAYLATLK